MSFSCFSLFCSETVATGVGYWVKTGNDKEDPGYDHPFTHPYLQTVGMFIGELSCLAVFYLLNRHRRSKGQPEETAKPGYSPLVLLLPACCDMTATSMMNVGLTMTYASVFQMLRGAVVIFTGIFSVVFLKRKLYPFHWLGMVLVLNGLLLVGVASVLQGSSSGASNPIVGDVLVIMAQFIVATQMVVGNFNSPLIHSISP